MKFLIVLAALAACCYAKPGGLVSPIAYNGLNYAGFNFGTTNTPFNYGYSAAVAPYNYGYSAYAAPIAHQAYAAPAYSYAAPAVAYSAPAVAYAGHAAYAAPVATGFKSQYHAQDELGQASYGHSEPLQTHNAVQDVHGNKVGSYSYVAPDGQVVRADYVADSLGYRVSSNALPVGPSDLPVGPVPVSDTPEVVAARAAHLAEFEAIKHRTKRGAIAVGHLPASTGPLAYASYAAPIAHAPLAYSAYAPYAHSHLAYSGFAPHAYTAAVAPVAYSAAVAPVAYSAAVAPVAYAAHVATPAVREATLTTVVNTPGHAVSYRVDK